MPAQPPFPTLKFKIFDSGTTEWLVGSPPHQFSFEDSTVRRAAVHTGQFRSRQNRKCLPRKGGWCQYRMCKIVTIT
jgi:hypothetical protein